MNYKKRLIACVLIMVLLAGAGCNAGHPKTENKSKETVNGFYVHEDIGESYEDPVIPEDAVEDVPEDITLKDNEVYLGTEKDPLTKAEQIKIEDTFLKESASSVTQEEKEEKDLGLRGKVSYYYYSKLEGEQKAVYRSILKGIRNHDEKIYVHATKDELNDYYLKVIYDHPELFWASVHYSYWDYDTYTVVAPKYNRSAEQMKKDKKKVNAAVNKIVKEASKEKNKYDRALYVYKYLIRNTKYKPDVKDNQNIYSVLINKVSVCAGYAKTTQLLLQKMGIQCVYVTGKQDKKTNSSHAWNIAKLGDKYYHIDTTWGDDDVYQSDKDYMRNLPEKIQYRFEYFCAADKMIFKSRDMDKHMGLPACQSTDKSFYVYNHRYFESYNDKVRNSIKKNIRDGKNYWHGQMATREAYNAFLNDVEDGLYWRYLYDIKGRDMRYWYWYYDEERIIKLYY